MGFRQKQKKLIKSSSQESSYTNLKRHSLRKYLKDPSESLGGLNGDGFPWKGGCFVKCVDNNQFTRDMKKEKITQSNKQNKFQKDPKNWRFVNIHQE